MDNFLISEKEPYLVPSNHYLRTLTLVDYLKYMIINITFTPNIDNKVLLQSLSNDSDMNKIFTSKSLLTQDMLKNELTKILQKDNFRLIFLGIPDYVNDFTTKFLNLRQESFFKDDLIAQSNIIIQSLNLKSLSNYLNNDQDIFFRIIITNIDEFPIKEECVKKMKQKLIELYKYYTSWNRIFLNRKFKTLQKICSKTYIDKIIDLLIDIKSRFPNDLLPIEKEKSTTEQDVIDHSKTVVESEAIENLFDDDDDDLDDIPANQTWKVNKKFIEQVISSTEDLIHLKYYGQNLILFYENRIAAVKKLLESKGMDNTKNFIGDVTIQNEQLQKIKDIQTDSLISNTDPAKLKSMFQKYYGKIGNEANEVMKKDYENRHKTIMYELLIKEYKLNINKIKQAIDIMSVDDESNIKISQDDKDLVQLLNGGSDSMTVQNGGLININNYDIIESEGDLNDNIDTSLSLIIQTYDFIQNDLITNPIVVSLLLEFVLKIQNARIDPSIITEGYFDLTELKLLFSHRLKSKSNILKGGATSVLVNLFYENDTQDIKNYKKEFTIQQDRDFKNLRDQIIQHINTSWTVSDQSVEKPDIKSNETFSDYIFLNKQNIQIDEKSNPIPKELIFVKQNGNKMKELNVFYKNLDGSVDDNLPNETHTVNEGEGDKIDQNAENIKRMQENLTKTIEQNEQRERKVAESILKIQEDIAEKNRQIEEIKKKKQN